MIARKIDDLKERSLAGQTKRGVFLLKEALQEEKLENLRLKIHQLQCENTLKQKVNLLTLLVCIIKQPVTGSGILLIG